jgi:hypothetical protein
LPYSENGLVLALVYNKQVQNVLMRVDGTTVTINAVVMQNTNLADVSLLGCSAYL